MMTKYKFLPNVRTKQGSNDRYDYGGQEKARRR